MKVVKFVRIELDQKQVEEINPRGLSWKGINDVFELLLGPPDGPKQKKFHDDEDLKTFRTYDDGNIYISRSCIAEEMGWRDINRVSRILSVLKKNATSESVPDLDFPLYFLEKEMGLNGTRCWRVDPEKVVKSISEAAESHYFPITEREEEIISNMIEKFWISGDTPSDQDIFEPKVLEEYHGKPEYEGSICYGLLHYFFLNLKEYEERDFECQEDWDVVRRLLDKYKRNGEEW